MPLTFMISSFEFTESEAVPDHVEGYPDARQRDTSKIWLEGEDTFSSEYYPLAIDIDDLPTARVLQAARSRLIRKTEPSAGSIQDRAHIRMPKQ